MLEAFLAPWVILSWLWCPGQAPDIADELSRLEGHRVTVIDRRDPRADPRDPCPASPEEYVIEDIAGEGKPLVGRVEARESGLHLVTADGIAHGLQGPLARKRIAGPGYKVWVLGEPRGGGAVFIRRIGILAHP